MPQGIRVSKLHFCTWKPGFAQWAGCGANGELAESEVVEMTRWYCSHAGEGGGTTSVINNNTSFLQFFVVFFCPCSQGCIEQALFSTKKS